MIKRSKKMIRPGRDSRTGRQVVCERRTTLNYGSSRGEYLVRDCVTGRHIYTGTSIPRWFAERE